MEKEINIAEILKDKPNGTKLYADAFGELRIEEICPEDELGITLLCKDGDELFFYNDGKYIRYGEPILVPSREIRDWSKFAWKKGDLLTNDCGFQCIFKEWASDDYTNFNGCYSNSRDGYEDVSNAETAKFEKLDDNIAHDYIKTIERKLGGKFNRETLEVEKPHPEFKDGDIITITPQIGDNLIFIFRAEDVEKYYCHAFLDGNIAIVNDDGYCKKDFCTARPSTEEEQEQFFEALAEKGKAWDAEKKAIVDLKPKCEFKPFDRCIWKIRNCEGSIWQASFISYVDEYGATPMGMSIDEDLVNLIILPYNEETAKLIGTTNNWEG